MYMKIEEIRIDDLPQDIENFQTAAVNMMIDPVNTAALFVFALNVYSQNKDQGFPLLSFLTDEGIKPSTLTNIERSPQIARSYLKGATSLNCYTPTHPLTILVRNSDEKGIKRNLKTVYIGCGGTDSYRPITLVKVKKRKLSFKSKFDLWYVYEYPSIILDVKPCKN